MTALSRPSVVLRPANDNSEMVPLWVCVRRMMDPAQTIPKDRQGLRDDD